MLKSTSIRANTALAWHFYRQEYSQSHQRLLRWVQGILLLFIITLSQSSDSIQNYLQMNLNGLLGADVVLSQQQSLTTEQHSEILDIADKVVVTQHVKTTLTHDGKWQQAQIKAVDSRYPLQGELITSSTLDGVGQSNSSGPQSGHIWLDARLLASLSLTIGDYLTIAEQRFAVSRILQHEPDRLMEGHTVAMRAMIHTEDMAALGFTPELIHYRYLIAANSEQTNQLIDWQKEHLPAAVIRHKQGQHPLALFWQRTENFMGLASIILFFMAAIAIEQLTQVHMKKDQFFSAVCMSLGASKAAGLRVSLLKWCISIVFLLPVVVFVSAGCHWLIMHFLSNTFSDLQWHWNFYSVVKPITAVVAIFAVFHMPVWLAVHKSSVARLFVGDYRGLSHWVSKISSILVLLGVTLIYSDNGLLTLMMVTVIAVTIALMIFLSWSSLTIGEMLTQRVSGLVPFALFMMKQRLVSKSTQIMGIGLCAFLLLFTLMLLKDLGQTMTSYQRQHDGNVFISKATQVQMEFIEDWASEQDISLRQIKPYMYAKLTAVNEQSLARFSQKPSDSMATFSQAIRLHWSQTVPQNNVVASGQWWQSDEQNWQQISIEQEVMTDLGLELGDWLTFYINQQSYDFEIVASHNYKPGAGSITFWVQMPPSALDHIQSPHFSMASMELMDEQWSVLAPLWQKFPTLLMVSLKELTQRFDKLLAMITNVISGFSLMIVLLAAVVILASINSLESNEKKKNSVIMSFGFSRSTCLKLNLIEWFVTASITAVGAILGTYIAGLLIYQSQFSLTYKPDFVWLFLTLLIILSLTTTLGVYASRNSLKSSVRQLLSGT